MPQAVQMTYPLSHYIEVLKAAGVLRCAPQNTDDIQIAFATDDSRAAVAGTLFVCKGAAFKRDYLVGAIEAGAVAYVSETDYDVDVPCLLVDNIRLTLAVLADAAYGHPSGRVQVCAFTGTKGKTTSAYYLKSVLDEHARRRGRHTAGLFSSIEFDDGVDAGISKLTTPEAFQLERQLANAADSGIEHVVMEASSQALKYDRTACVEFAVGAFTNIGEDHISPIEHPTFEDYFSSKLKLFAQSRAAVVNLDMDHVDRVLEAAQASTPSSSPTPTAASWPACAPRASPTTCWWPRRSSSTSPTRSAPSRAPRLSVSSARPSSTGSSTCGCPAAWSSIPPRAAASWALWTSPTTA